MSNLNDIELLGKIDGEKESMGSYYIIGFVLGFLSFLLLLASPKTPTGANFLNLNSNSEREAYAHGFQTTLKKRRVSALTIGMVIWLVIVVIWLGL